MSDWLTFTYSWPQKKNSSSSRVNIWRRLRRLGAVSLTGSVYLLPSTDETLEAFQWLAQEVEHAGGESNIMHVNRFYVKTEQDIISLFHVARAEDYSKLESELKHLVEKINISEAQKTQENFGKRMKKLQKKFNEIQSIDYFRTPEVLTLKNKFASIQQRLIHKEPFPMTIQTKQKKAYKNKTWVTRPKPYIDRLASIWLVRRFIDTNVKIRYSSTIKSSEVSFDMPNAEFGHIGNLCTFEVLLKSFGLESNTLSLLAEIIHQLDLNDGNYAHPEALGIESIINGWKLQNLHDKELEQRGVDLFESLYTALLAKEK